MYLLPQPNHISEKSGSFELEYCRTIRLSVSCPQESLYHAELLQKEIEQYAGCKMQIVRGASVHEAIILDIEPAECEEGYRLSISEDAVHITGNSSRGLLWGIQTLRQIIRQEGAVLPCLEIEDAPEIPNRGYYHDVTRGRIPTLSYLKHLADTLSFYKINQLQLYIEHTYLFEGLSEMWRDDTPLTAADILELDRYCRSLGIDLVPSLSCFGHLYKLLRTKSFRDLCELPDPDKEPFGLYARQCHHTLNVTDGRSMELVRQMIDEYMPLFSSKYFNIGADETFDLGKGKSAEEAERTGVKRMYIDFVKELCEYVVSKGKTPMFWGDVICGFPEYIGELPEETICLNWGYAPDQNEESTRKLAEAGAVQYVCPGVSGWNQMINQMEDAYENIRRMCSYGRKYGAVGVLNTDWGDFGHINHPEFSIPGMICGACFSWNSRELSFEELNRAVSVLEFMDPTEKITGIAAQMAKKDVFTWRRAVVYQEVTQDNAEIYDSDRGLLEFQPELEEKLLRANEELAQLKREMALCTRRMDSSMRGKVQAYQTAADGILTWNRIGLAMLGCFSAEEMKRAAAELENWFMHYKNLWRSVSRQSELDCIAHVVFWWADRVRELAKDR